MMFLPIGEKYPLEKYIINCIKKYKGDPVKAFEEIYVKYPFFVKSALRQVITALIKTQIAKEKISGYWRKVDRIWALNKYDPNINPKTGKPFDDMEISLPDPQSDTGPSGKGVYTRPSKKSLFDTEAEPQETYERMHKKYQPLIKDPIELDKILVQELINQGFGNKITEIKFKSKRGGKKDGEERT